MARFTFPTSASRTIFQIVGSQRLAHLFDSFPFVSKENLLEH